MADRTLDTSGLMCPLPVLKAKKAIQQIAPGELLEIIATDPGSVADFEVFCKVQGHRLRSSTRDGATFRFEIERGG